MIGVAVEASAPCRKCGADVHVNALVTRVRCARCGRMLDVPPKIWGSLLGRALSEAPGWPERIGRHKRLLTKRGEYSALVGRQEPCFRDTHTPIDMETVDPVGGICRLVNPESGRQAIARTLPDELRSALPGVIQLVGEDPGLLAAAGVTLPDVRPARIAGETTVNCTQCGAGIDVAAEERLVTCPFCDTVSFLPDELWRKLNPDSRPLRWYLWVDAPDRAPASPEPTGEDDENAAAPASAPPIRVTEQAIWVALRVDLKCDSCMRKMPINALVPRVTCPKCGETRNISPLLWLRMLGENLASAPRLRDSDFEYHSCLSGADSFDVAHARSDPPLPGQLAAIQATELQRAVREGSFSAPSLPRPWSLREAPEEIRRELPGLLFLLDEAPELLPAPVEGAALPGRTRDDSPRALGCPHCGGALDVDGTQRCVPCPFCEGRVSLPWDFWLRLHAQREQRTWYALYDESQAPFEWTGDTHDAVVDGKGRLFLTCRTHAAEKGMLVGLDESYRPRWIHEGIEDGSDADTGTLLATDSDGRVVLWADASWKSARLLRFDPETGEQVTAAGGSGSELWLDKLVSAAFGPDETVLALQDLRGDGLGESTYSLRRWGPGGDERPVWSGEEPTRRRWRMAWKRFKDAVLVSIGARARVDPRSVEHCGSWVRELAMTRTRLAVGHDGCTYVLDTDHRYLAKFDRFGRKIYAVELPCEYVHGRIAADREGAAYALVEPSDRSRAVLRVSADGGEIRTIVGPLGGDCYEKTLAVGPEGPMYLLADEGVMRVFDLSGELLYRSRAASERLREP